MKKQLLTGAVAFGTVAIASLFQAAPAQAITFGFQNISNNNTTDAAIGESQLLVDVTDDGSNGVNFRFENIGDDRSTISEIYFDDGIGALTGSASLTEGTGVDFVAGSASPGNLPSRNSADPNFNVTNGFLADAVNPAPSNGINNKDTLGSDNEYLTINYSLAQGITFNDLITALTNPDFDNNNDFRIGLHVINFASGGSESFINEPGDTTPVPTPALLPGLIGMGVASLRKKKKQVGEIA